MAQIPWQEWGDEFVILLENMVNINDVSIVIETLDKSFSKAFIIDGNNIEVCCSVGLVIYPEQGATMSSLMTAADKDMYKTKRRDGD